MIVIEVQFSNLSAYLTRVWFLLTRVLYFPLGYIVSPFPSIIASILSVSLIPLLLSAMPIRFSFRRVMRNSLILGARRIKSTPPLQR